MKHIYILFRVSLCSILLFTSSLCSIFAQQQPMFTQYMYNGLLINPAYAGNKLALEASLTHRRQFEGFEGAPKTQVLTVQAPVAVKNFGLGLKLMNETLGPAIQTNGIGICYAYQLKFAKSRLAMGLELSLVNQLIDFPSLRRIDNTDPNIPNRKESIWVPDAGLGVYYDAERYFAGFSTFNLLNNKYEYDAVASNSLSGNLFRHYYLYGGYNFVLSKNVKFTPALLGKFVNASPAQFDFNTNFIFYEELAIGAGYRSDNTAVGMIRINFSKKLSFTYSYDFGTSAFGTYHKGNHEFMLSFRTPLPPPPGRRIIHPRYYF